jgi:hypothetical protein
MSTHDEDVALLRAMVEDVRRIRNRTCEPEDRSNPRYHALSMAVSGLLRAADDMQDEDRRSSRSGMRTPARSSST